MTSDYLNRSATFNALLSTARIQGRWCKEVMRQNRNITAEFDAVTRGEHPTSEHDTEIYAHIYENRGFQALLEDCVKHRALSRVEADALATISTGADLAEWTIEDLKTEAVA